MLYDYQKVAGQLRQMFYSNRKSSEILNDFFGAGWGCMQSLMELTFAHPLKCGAVRILHLAGRKPDYKPHVHILSMTDGIDESKDDWIDLEGKNQLRFGSAEGTVLL